MPLRGESLLIIVWRDEAVSHPIPFRRLGSDCAEDWFSLLGGFIENKRTYTVCEALQTIRTMLRAWEITGTHGLNHKGRRPVGEVPWEELEERRGDQAAMPTDSEVKRSWLKGRARAKKVWKDDLHGKPYRQGSEPVWWRNPTFELRVEGLENMDSLFRSEADMLEENGDASCAVGAGVEAECVRDDIDGGDVGGGRGNEEGDGERGEDARNVALVEEVCHVMTARVKQWMDVPGRGRVHKRTICAWAGSRSENLSGHLAMRAAQAGSRACVDMVGQGSVFDIQTDAWVVELGSDIAVVFDEDVQIGSIFMIRRRYANGGYNQYTRPVDLHAARAAGWDLGFVCCWYERQTDGTYRYGSLDTDSYELKHVACPVTLQHDEGGVYRMPPDQQVLIDEARKEFELD